jgi:cytochrome P450
VASAADTAALTADVLLPTLALGPIIRRPRMVHLIERHDLVRRAVERMQRLHETYGDGPLMLRIPVRNQAVVLAPHHVHRVLAESPEPFRPDSSEKRAALSHFNPETVLISRGPERAERRRFNEDVLDTDRPMHRLAARFADVIEEEAITLIAEARQRDELDWPTFNAAWFRIVRRVMLGDAARDDVELTRTHARLRAYANLAFMQPQRHALRAAFLARVRGYLSRAEPGSLAEVMASAHQTVVTEPEHQVPHWMFAADPAGMTTFRTLALLAAHPEHQRRARDEVAHRDQTPELPFLRRCVLESLRLWPTTPAILRQTSTATSWEAGTMPANTGLLVYTPYFHRDDRHLDIADQFAPAVWSEERTSSDWPFVPFSEGPVGCPAQHLVLMLTSTMLAELLRLDAFHERVPVKLQRGRPLPRMLDPYTLRFALTGAPP